MPETSVIDVGERRRDRRYAAQAGVMVRRADAPGPVIHGTRNFSADGLSFLSDQPFAPGERLGVGVPGLDRLGALPGEVIWCTAGGKPAAPVYSVGVKLEGDAHRRDQLLEALHRIELYRRSQRIIHRRRLTAERATAEWVAHRGLELNDKEFAEQLGKLLDGKSAKIWLAKSHGGRLDTVFSVGEAQGEAIHPFDHIGGYYLIGEGVPEDLYPAIHELFVRYCKTQSETYRDEHMLPVEYHRRPPIKPAPRHEQVIMHVPLSVHMPGERSGFT
jgi:hypothetical protein